jgi:hypothetical protein
MTTIEPTTLLNMTESETFDFKSGQYKFYGANDDEKGELLKDVIAFANAWKTGDAFIVIGVAATNGRKDQIVGASSILQDNDIQQFVNAKTNRRINFLVYTDTAEGQPINVIQISREQQRPIFLTKNFGRLAANACYVRSGSSTAIATPDQIAAMVSADHDTAGSQANIELEWADGFQLKRLGKSASITCCDVTIKPEPPPEPASPIAPSMHDIYERMMVETVSLPVFSGPSEEDLQEFVRKLSAYAAVRVWLNNVGKHNVSSVNVSIEIKKELGLQIVEEGDQPQKPSPHLMPSIASKVNAFGPFVEENKDSWQIDIHAPTIQPQREHWSGRFYVTSDRSRTIAAMAKIFADDLAQPIQVPLNLTIDVDSREMSGEALLKLLENSEDD